jgi:hypothetical protein
MTKELFAVAKDNRKTKNKIMSKWVEWEEALKICRKYQEENPKEEYVIIPNQAWYKNLWK